jgi:hypothetical protein
VRRRVVEERHREGIEKLFAAPATEETVEAGER